MIVNCKKSDSVNLNRTAPSIIRAICFVATLAITFVCLSGSSSAQQIQIQFGGQLAQGQTQQIDAEAGAVLKTNPELEDVLQTAERKREDGQYRVASKLWQIVLERSGDALYSDDSSTYFS
jgi:hypothetical protein